MEYYIFSGFFLLLGLWNLTIAVLGLFPRFLSSAVGTLAEANTKHNFRRRPYHTIIPIYTWFTYTYSVNGKIYRYKAEGIHSKTPLFRKVSMVYVKWFPRYAYPNKFTGAYQWLFGILWSFCGLLLIYVVNYA